MGKIDSKPVELACHAFKARTVLLTGAFNAWRQDATPLHSHRPKGKWTVTLRLPPEHYEYKFVVDGKWCCDPGCEPELQGCPQCAPNDFGTMNRVLEVS